MKRGGELQRKTPLRAKKPMARGKPMARSRSKRKPSTKKPPGFSEEVRMAVRRRSGGRCEARTEMCNGQPAHLHHRKLRRFRDNTLACALFVCAPCHTHIHANPSKSRLMGWLVASYEDPAEIPVRPGSGGR